MLKYHQQLGVPQVEVLKATLPIPALLDELLRPQEKNVVKYITKKSIIQRVSNMYSHITVMK